MDTPIFMQRAWADHPDDPAHPIPSLTALDACAIRREGGADLSIVIATPLRDDDRSRARLLAKIDLYLQFLQSAEFRRESGVATTANTTILVSIHPDSDAAVFDLLDSCRGWVLDHGASLTLELRHTSVQ